jgi:DNA-binding response OmpR family regulator
MSHILIVEDEAAIAAFIARGLQGAGFATTEIDTGERAVTAMRSAAYDLAILDLGLPDVDGFEVLRRVRAAGSGLPVIILTARSSVLDTVAALENGADDYMPKPFSFEELLARVRLRLRPVNTE